MEGPNEGWGVTKFCGNRQWLPKTTIEQPALLPQTQAPIWGVNMFCGNRCPPQLTPEAIVTKDIDQVTFCFYEELSGFQEGLQNLIADRKTGPDCRNVFMEGEDDGKQ